MNAFDHYITQTLTSFVGHWVCFDSIAIVLGRYVVYGMIFLLFVFLLWKTREHLFLLVQAVLAGILARFVIVEVIRMFVHRVRPFEELSFSPLITQLNEFPRFFSNIPPLSLLEHSSAVSSFPSGHAALAFAIATVVFLYNRKLGVVFFVISIFMGIARIYGGVHWFSDILGGAVIGIFSALLIFWIFKKIVQELKRRQVFKDTD